ncbi:peroxidase [Marchantia polymorpha subsp. ruderalis]|uniref:Peroxidase n=2 Tax=Marchantia polymorpha TaxID=3197 RepID=A0A176WSR9_MARPO|nr:hypothetical protein AXG93_4409s1010 [Marchantia polymorpha subsp. ruderalis]PTQ29918.1 hypothetical protein MARPO_0133s0056 [Marchantia polymorpha]BBN10404.1 hypothetical protein Mp_5g03300 [Marchantia polymorpha subsp. ruderalis]|eukprot:PTQ29918.1 hypothetical protein MARPO_0133s0056 [Marchantia polymorpha]
MAAKLSSSVLLFIGLAVLYAAIADAQLSESFYSKSCPGGVAAVANVVNTAVRNDRRNAAGLLRLHFHDCFVRGCDASVLLFSTASSKAEKDAPPNLSLQGFSIIDQAKAALEKTCPGVFSCSDILALAARDAISVIGGPQWKVPLGRRDGVVSLATEANSNLPSDKSSFSGLVSNFAKKGLSESDMVVLSGAHTIGLTVCKSVTPRIYNFAGSVNGADPYLNSTFVTEKRGLCPNNKSSANKFIAIDSTKGGQSFDKNYYSNVFAHKAIFKSDDALISTSSGRTKVLDIIRSPQSKFFSQFGLAMEKMGRIGVLTGSQGQIRKTCSKKN